MGTVTSFSLSDTPVLGAERLVEEWECAGDGSSLQSSQLASPGMESLPQGLGKGLAVPQDSQGTTHPKENLYSASKGWAEEGRSIS